MSARTINITPEIRDRVAEEIWSKKMTFRFDTKDYPLEYIRDKMNKNIFVIPDYQRQYIWPEENRSYFIESLFLGLPIPIIFLGVGENTVGRYEIIDGLQRMATVRDFLDGKIVLQGLEKIPSLNGFTFDDLLPVVQEEFRNITLRTVILYQTMKEEHIRDLFKRINTTSEKLSEFEVIYGTCPSEFMQMVVDFENDEDFCSVTPFSKAKEKINRRERGYLALRFFILVDHYTEIKGRFYDYAYQFAQEEAPKLTSNQLDDYRALLRKVLGFVKQYFDSRGLGKTANQTPRIRFEALAVGIALAIRENSELKSSKEIVTRLLESKTLQDLTPRGASSNSKLVVERIEYVRDYFLQESK
ncbi:MAG: DUF262 domain-containing protein [Thermoguttaceae bacterium]|nr:DUF262 domain-containing protein [Thermoguttaceae bacterium]